MKSTHSFHTESVKSEKSKEYGARETKNIYIVASKFSKHFYNGVRIFVKNAIIIV